MMLKRIFFIGLLFPVGFLYAQTDFRSGYVITNSNDTLYGEIDYRGDMLMGQICTFKTNENDIVEYTPYDIAAYRFHDSKYFVSREVAGRKAFLEYLIKGQANIYYMRDKTGDRYFIDKEDMPLSEMPYEKGIREIDGKQYVFATKTHLGILNYYMQDAPDIQTQIKKVDKLEHNNLIKLAENYHYAVCLDGSSCIVFEKKQPFTKVSMYAVGGMVYYETGVSSFTSGILLDLWMPRANEKIYFRTGLLYLQYTIKNLNTIRSSSIYKIPFMVEYIYPKTTIIKPKIAYGPIFHLNYSNKQSGMGTSFMAGINIRLNDSMSLTLEYNADLGSKTLFLPIPIPKQFLSNSFLSGFRFEF